MSEQMGKKEEDLRSCKELSFLEDESQDSFFAQEEKQKSTKLVQPLSDFTRAIFRRESLAAYVLSSFASYEFAPHHFAIIRALESIERGHLKKLLITCPPRYGKSTLVAEFFPAWYLGRRPDQEIMYSTYAQSFADLWGQKVKDQMNSPSFALTFSSCKLKSDARSSRRIRTQNRGGYLCVGRSGGLTGRGADGLILDDLLKNREEAQSEKLREKIWDFYVSTARTRLHKGGWQVLMATRWHEDDLTGRLLSCDPDWKQLHIPALDEHDQSTWESRFPAEDKKDKKGQVMIEGLLSKRRIMGDYEFESLYQGRPAPKKGAFFNVENLGEYQKLPPDLFLVQALDPAAAKGSQNDYSACVSLGTDGKHVFVIDAWRMRLDFNELMDQCQQSFAQIKPHVFLVEQASVGIPLCSELRRKSAMPVVGIYPSKDKATRAFMLQGAMAAGRIHLPKNAPWKALWLAEFRAFPAGKHDDLVDASVHAFNHLNQQQRPAKSFKSPCSRF